MARRKILPNYHTIGLRLVPGDLEALDRFIAELEVEISRSAAIRHILRKGLAGHYPSIDDGKTYG